MTENEQKNNRWGSRIVHRNSDVDSICFFFITNKNWFLALEKLYTNKTNSYKI
jgi:hypothetical protein